MNNRRHVLFLIGFLLCVACENPNNVQVVDGLPPIFPDYTDVTIPCNIAPLNFTLRNHPQSIEVVLKGRAVQVRFMGKDKIQFSENRWKKFLQIEQGDTVTVQITAKVQGRWIRYRTFEWTITKDKLDPYLTYQSIEPGYEVWHNIQLRERNIENFSVDVIADNNLTGESYMSSFVFGNQNPNLSFFLLRGEKGGLLLNRNGHLRKINTQANLMGKPVTYGNLHPSEKYGVFSTNASVPEFHTLAAEKLEVYDEASDLLILDFDNDRIIQSPLVSGNQNLETFPVFSAGGDRIYYCVAPAKPLPDSIKQLKYSLCSIPFDPQTGQFGNSIDTLIYMDEDGKSISFPKPSPDGRFLLYCVSDYGAFPVWHKDTDLQMLDLHSGEINDLQVVNSDYSDTCHSWSSNSRWFVFASKRDDGLYGKPYFCYVDTSGKVHKPFVLPQQDPYYYDYTLRSFNIPELATGKLPFSAIDIEHIYWKENAEQFH